MIKFLDLSTGYSFDGLWTENQSKGYIFWFPKEQGIGLTYTMPIAIVSDNDMGLTLTMETNDVFSFISHNDENIVINGYTFDGVPKREWTISTTPEEINGKYIHTFNVACCSQSVGEYICKIKIDDLGYIRVGADFYGEQESLYINLSNMGTELPTSIQKAIYDSNVHEDLTDDILINRKFKELLSNYWEIIANKGSYKSLLNSLKWFEWNDVLCVKEIQKNVVADKTFFRNANILSAIENQIDDTFNNFAKTTYISLYLSMQEELPSYDNEYNPELAAAALKWSRNDIQLKIAMLAQFFGIYFLPIHLSILHATSEDKVFTNTIKAIHGAGIKRNDCIGDFEYVECNVKDNTIYKLTNVNAQVSTETVFGVKYPDDQPYDDQIAFIGVDMFPTDSTTGNGKYISDDMNTFAAQYYGGPGVIIPFKMTIPNQTTNDFVNRTIIDYGSDKRPIIRTTLYDIFNVVDNSININFNLLVKDAGNYIINFTFITGSGKTITHTVKFIVEDADNLNINVYKVHAKDDTNGLTMMDFMDTNCSKYLYQIQNKFKDTDNSYYIQHLPYMLPDNEDYTNYSGIKLSRTVVVNTADLNNDDILILRGIMNDYLEFARYKIDEESTEESTNNIKYMIFVSKKFYDKLPDAIFNNVYNIKYDVIRNDLGFYPQFHYLEKMDGDSIDNYTVSPYEAVCCAAEINDGDTVKPFRYGHIINSAEWTFFNHLTNETIVHQASSQMPFVAKSESDGMQPGYYDITFKYNLTNGVDGECTLNSAFRIK